MRLGDFLDFCLIASLLLFSVIVSIMCWQVTMDRDGAFRSHSDTLKYFIGRISEIYEHLYDKVDVYVRVPSPFPGSKLRATEDFVEANFKGCLNRCFTHPTNPEACYINAAAHA